MVAWFDDREAKELGVTLAKLVIKDDEKSNSKNIKKDEIKRMKMLNSLTNQIDIFKKNHVLNIYKKAKFINSFKWTLKEAGYQNDYINQFANAILLRF